ncbi:unnamed protein product, partial [Durusdinium trenchii]
RLRQSHLASLCQRLSRAQGPWIRGQQFLQWLGAAGVLLPHHGRTRRSGRYRCEDCGDRIH